MGGDGGRCCCSRPSPALRPRRRSRAELAEVGDALAVAGVAAATVLVLAVGARPAAVLDGLRRAGVRRVDLVVAPVGGSSVEALVTVVRQRVAVDQVWLAGSTGRSGRAGRRPIAGGDGPSPASSRPSAR